MTAQQPQMEMYPTEGKSVNCQGGTSRTNGQAPMEKGILPRH